MGARFPFVAAAFLSAPLSAQITLVSTTPAGANSGGDVQAPTVSDDGRYVTLEGFLPNVGSGVLVKDRVTGAVVRASVATGGAQAASGVRAMISGDGKFVVFTSYATNLVPGDTNAAADVFVHELATVTTTRVSVSTSGQQGDAASDFATVSGDGRFVAFQSLAKNLVLGDTNNMVDVFVHDRVLGTTQIVSLNASGGPCAGGAGYPRISADGRVIAYSSVSNDIVLPDNFTAGAELYARDLPTGVTTRVSLTSAGAQGVGTFYNLGSEYPWCGGMSRDGSFIAFVGSLGMDAAYPNEGLLYLRDRSAGTTRLVSVSPIGQTLNADHEGGTMTDDGRFVVYGTHQRMTPDDVNPDCDVYVRDMALGTTRRVSPELPGQLNNSFQPSGDGVMTPSGSTVVFESSSPHLLAIDTDSFIDAYAFDFGQLAPESYCTAGTSSQGCTAVLTASGTPSVSSGSPFNLNVVGAAGQRTSLLVYGISGRQSAAWGPSSFACVRAPRQRTGLQSTGGTAGACNGAFVVDWNAFVASHPLALGSPWLALTPVQAQAYVRDPQSGAPGSVLSNAIEFYALP